MPAGCWTREYAPEENLPGHVQQIVSESECLVYLFRWHGGRAVDIWLSGGPLESKVDSADLDHYSHRVRRSGRGFVWSTRLAIWPLCCSHRIQVCISFYPYDAGQSELELKQTTGSSWG